MSADSFPLGSFKEDLAVARRRRSRATLDTLVSPRWCDQPRYEIVDTGHDTPCWLWLASLTPSGYGRIGLSNLSSRTFGRRQIMAHNLYWERANGPIPDGLELDHLCRVRRCVNPTHLEPVTRAENLRRRPRRYKLTADDVQAIRASDESLRIVAQRFGITKSTASAIRRRMIWCDIPEKGHA